MIQLQLILKKDKSYKILEFIQYSWKNGRIRKDFPIWSNMNSFYGEKEKEEKGILAAICSNSHGEIGT